jgi:hypothetical protein
VGPSKSWGSISWPCISFFRFSSLVLHRPTPNLHLALFLKQPFADFGHPQFQIHRRFHLLAIHQTTPTQTFLDPLPGQLPEVQYLAYD